MLPLVVQVRDRDLKRRGVLSDEDLTDFQLFPAKNDVGTWSLKLPHLVRSESGKWVRHRLGQVLATPGAGISVALPGGRRFSGPMLTPEFEETTSDPGGTWTYTGVSDLIVLADRAAFPNPAIADAQASSASRAYDVRTGKAESLMLQFVGANIGPTATAERRDSRITLAADLGRGTARTKSVRFASLLELCQELAAIDGLLFDLVQVDEKLEFRVSTPADLTGTVRMDIASDQLASAKFSFSPPAATRVIVLGQGEADQRVIRTRTTTPAQEASEAWGRVIERIVDQRQTNSVDEMDAAGDEILTTDGTEIQSLEVTPSDVNARQLGTKWWIGDLVTVNAAGVAVKADIAKVRVSVGPDGIFAGATVGDPIGFDADRVTNARIGSVESRVSSLERNGQSVSWASVVDKPATFPASWATLLDKPTDLPTSPSVYGGSETVFHDVLGGVPGSISGPFVIQTPITHTNQMVRVKIEGYDYSTGTNDLDLNLTFYAYQPDGNFYSNGVTSIGNREVSVKLARNSAGKIAIIVSPVGPSFSILRFSVPSVHIGHTLAPADWGKNWSFSTPASLTGYVNVTDVAMRQLSAIPVGTISQYAGAAAPAGYVFANGQPLSTTTYAALFAAIGYTYGGSGATFNVPNLSGRVPVGIDSTQTEFNTRGKIGGAKTHTLTTAEMPSHTHSYNNTFNASNAVFNVAGGTGMDNRFTNLETSGATGGGGAHNNLQPYIALNYIIKT
jgi:microcystin-dependent protein